MAQFTPQEISKLEIYLRKVFGNTAITLKIRERAADSVELLIGAEFLGVIYKDQEDGETSYDFNMSVLAEDIG
jgi:hypothetical protein